MRAVVVTVSTSKARGDGRDESGPKLAEAARAMGAQIAATEVVPDDQELIEARLRHWADSQGCELILTTGGTGFPDPYVATHAVAMPATPRSTLNPFFSRMPVTYFDVSTS